MSIAIENVSTKCLENDHSACPTWSGYHFDPTTGFKSDWRECECPCHLANALDLKAAAVQNMEQRSRMLGGGNRY